MGPLDKFILSDNALSISNNEIVLAFHSHWYRSLPVASLVQLQVEINQKIIDLNKATFRLEEKRFNFNDIEKMYNDWWFILDPIYLYTDNTDCSIRPNDLVDLKITIGLSMPYILTGKEGVPLLASSTIHKKLTCL